MPIKPIVAQHENRLGEYDRGLWHAALVPIFPWVVNTVDVLIYEP
ncbi:MAG TPA: hypothetical protein VN826_09620 [Candidatus Eisenbacteria bacterium]|jgi:hypothetical protein|nr:hypothetical protein [Candidatus Eisenbacteria bacterium]